MLETDKKYDTDVDSALWAKNDGPNFIISSLMNDILQKDEIKIESDTMPLTKVKIFTK